MKLNRTKVLVISLVVITIALGGAALYIANRLQNQIQTPSSAATITPPTYKCTVVYFKDAALTTKYNASEEVPANTNLYLAISREATGSATQQTGVRNVGLKKGNTRIGQVGPLGNNYQVTVQASQVAVGDNTFQFGFNTKYKADGSADLTDATTGDWCTPFTLVGKAATAAADPVCREMVIGKTASSLVKKNVRSDALLIAPGETLTIKYTLGNATAGDTRRIHIKNDQNFRVATDMNQQLLVSYSNTNNAKLLTTGVAATGTDQSYTYTLTYAELFPNDMTALSFPYSPAEKPQWASGTPPNILQISGTVKKATATADGTFDKNCVSYVKRVAISPVTTTQTSTSQCVGMTIGKNGGTQAKKNTRDNPLLLTTGDTLNVTHTLSNVPASENSRTLRMYNAQNISADGNNSLNSFTSYNSSTATFQIANKVANGSNSEFKYTLTYAELFKADTTALVKAATPAESPQWASGGIPNLVKIAVPVKPFSTGIEGTFDNNCIAYVSRVGISLASTSGENSGSNDDLPATDLSAFDIFKLIGGAIFLLGGITIMKYRSRFENI
jgi:hypothetical protein